MDSETFGSAMRRLRKARGLSLRALAGQVFLSHGYLHQFEQGRPVSPDYAQRIDRALDASGELIALATGQAFVPPEESVEALRVACEWLATEPPQVEQLRSGRRVGAKLAEITEVRLRELRRLDDHLGGADTMELVEQELRDTEAVVREGSYTEETGRRLLAVVAELYQLAGWTVSDAGQHARAERLYLDGVRAAHAARDSPSAGNLLSCLSYQIANVGRPSDAVLLARMALRGTDQTASGRVRALLLERVAWAHARAGENSETDRTLDQVREAFAIPGENEPDWVYWLDSTEVDVMAGRCYVELRRPLRAVPLLADAIEGYPEDRLRETALYRTWLAESYLQANERDAARDVLSQVEAAAGEINSERLASRVRYLVTELG